jgi:hypothetical protein
MSQQLLWMWSENSSEKQEEKRAPLGAGIRRPVKDEDLEDSVRV